MRSVHSSGIKWSKWIRSQGGFHVEFIDEIEPYQSQDFLKVLSVRVQNGGGYFSLIAMCHCPPLLSYPPLLEYELLHERLCLQTVVRQKLGNTHTSLK